MASGAGASFTWSNIVMGDQATAHIGHNFITNIQVTSSLARQVYQTCMRSGSSFHPLAKEVASFRGLLEMTEETIAQSDIQHDHTERITTVVTGCKQCLEDIQLSVAKYNDLPTGSKRTWERMNFGAEALTELHYRIGQNTSLLSALNSNLSSSSQSSIKVMLQKFMDEIRAGKREGSVISSQTEDSLKPDERSNWEMLRRELADIGITPELFSQHKDLITQTLKDFVASGALNEQPPADINVFEEISKTDSGRIIPYQECDQSLARSMLKRFSAPDKQLPPKFQEVPGNTITLNSEKLYKSLYTAIQKGHISSLAKLLKRKLLSKRYLDFVIDEVCYHGSAEFLTLLLDEGADMEMEGCTSTALIEATKYGHRSLVEILLNRGADIKGRNDELQTALIIAGHYGRHQIVRLLIDRGAEIEAKDTWGKTALICASSEGEFQTVQLLLDRGANLEAWDLSGRTSLATAVGRLQFAVFLFLVVRGANCAVIDLGGNALLAILEDAMVHDSPHISRAEKDKFLVEKQFIKKLLEKKLQTQP